MYLRKFLPRNRVLLWSFVCAILISAALAVMARPWRSIASTETISPISLKSAPKVPQRHRAIADFESELITITSHGFEPHEISRPSGRFLLMVDNRSGLAETSLALSRQSGLRTHEMRVPREAPNWSEVVNLSPGEYVLSEASHPGWTCHITITAQ